MMAAGFRRLPVLLLAVLLFMSASFSAGQLSQSGDSLSGTYCGATGVISIGSADYISNTMFLWVRFDFNRGGIEGAYTLRGSYVDATRNSSSLAVSLTYYQWIYQPSGFSPVDFPGTLSTSLNTTDNSTTLSFIGSGSSCAFSFHGSRKPNSTACSPCSITAPQYSRSVDSGYTSGGCFLNDYSLPCGAQCALSCAYGSPLNANVTSCDANGVLSLQICSQATCSMKDPTSGSLAPNCNTTLLSGDSCSITCNSGFMPSKSLSSCSSTGVLTAQTCIPAVCSVPASLIPAHGGRGNCPSSLTGGGSCQLNCTSSYVLNTTLSLAAGQITCSENGVLNVVPAQCVTSCTVVTPNAYTGMGNCPATLPIGASCQMSCSNNQAIFVPSASNTTCVMGTLVGPACYAGTCAVSLPRSGTGISTCPSVLLNKQQCITNCSSGFSLAVGATNVCSQGVPVRQACEPPCSIAPPASASWGSCPTSGSLMYGDLCSWSCPVGQQPYPLYITCNALAQVSAVASCTSSCMPGDVLGSSNMGNCPATMASGTSCTPGCMISGYTASGSITCQGGILSFTGFQCTPSPCTMTDDYIQQNYWSDATLVPGACPSPMLDSSSCTPVLCDTKHGWTVINSGNFQVKCSNGKLTRADTTTYCHPNSCSIEPPVNGNIGNCVRSGTVSSGETCSFLCNSGYVLSGAVTSCTAGLLTAQSCVLPDALSQSSNSDHQSIASALGGVFGSLGGFGVALLGWYWKHSNDQRKRVQRRPLAASVYAHLPVVDAGDFDSVIGGEFVTAVGDLALRLESAYPQCTNGISLLLPRVPPSVLEILGSRIAQAAGDCGIKARAHMMPSWAAWALPCKQFKGALVIDFADVSNQNKMVVMLAGAMEAIKGELQKIVDEPADSVITTSPLHHTNGLGGVDTSTSTKAQLELVKVELMPSVNPTSDSGDC